MLMLMSVGSPKICVVTHYEYTLILSTIGMLCLIQPPL